MNPNDIIETYVGDVVRHLARKHRNDVAFELRSLLAEELQGRALEVGRAADATMTYRLLATFGRPADVADRYRPAGFAIIRPADVPRFAWIGLGGVAVQWVLSLVATYTAPVASDSAGSDWLSRLGSWWLTWGLGAFWWPGFIVSMMVIAGALASRRQESGEWVAPRAGVLDRDLIRRPIMVLYIALGVGGASIVIALPSLAIWGSGLPGPLIEAFAFDPDFLSWRAPWVIPLWAVSLAVGITLLVVGRWGGLTRRVALIGNVALLALLVWWIVAGPIFESDVANGITKVCLALIVALTLLDTVINVRRLVSPIRTPTVPT
ncbi:MAG: hypothetical protein V4531_14325 [Actinomycetota bacterium]